MVTKKKQRKTEDENCEFKVEWTESLLLYKTQMAFQPGLFIKKNWHTTRNQIWRDF